MDVKNYIKQNIDVKDLKNRYDELLTIKTKWYSLWEDIAKYCRIEKQEIATERPETSGHDLDHEINDPTALMSVNSAANNLYGILIGDGDFFTLDISEELQEELVDNDKDILDYIKYINKKALREFNKSDANFKNSMLMHLKDQATFGTSGIGSFISNNYIEGKTNNIFEFVNFGIDNIVIDEGRNGIVDTVYSVYTWRINKIVKTFCSKPEGGIDEEKYNRLPEKIRKSFEEKPNDKYKITFAIVSNDFFKKGVEGKLGSKYLGVWYINDCEDYILDIEFFKNFPINIVRVDKLRGEIYGRADGTKLISSIRLLDYLVGDLMEASSKMIRPALGVVDGSLTGDKVIDTTANSATTVQIPNGVNNPIFPLIDVKDPSAIANILIPYLKENIASGFKTDILLDTNDQQAKTATEMIQRYNIRSKLLYSMVFQQSNELLEPLIKNVINIMYEIGEAGETEVNLEKDQNNEAYKIIPEKIQQYQRDNKDWFKIKFNNEVSKMSRANELENINQFLMFLQGTAQFNPEILQSVKWYELISNVEGLLNYGETYILSKTEYNTLVEDLRNLQQQSIQQQQQLENAEANKNNSQAIKNQSEAMKK